MSSEKIAAVKERSALKQAVKDVSQHTTAEGQGTHVALTLTFLRSVGTTKVVDAIVDALMGKEREEVYKTSLSEFKNILVRSIGDTGIAQNEEIAFLLDAHEGIIIYVRGKVAGYVESQSLRENLVALYLGENSIVPLMREAFLNYMKN